MNTPWHFAGHCIYDATGKLLATVEPGEQSMSVLRRMVQADEMADVLEDMRGRVIDCPVTYCKGVGRRIDEILKKL